MLMPSEEQIRNAITTRDKHRDEDLPATLKNTQMSDLRSPVWQRLQVYLHLDYSEYSKKRLVFELKQIKMLFARVIRGDGNLGEYRWGLERKRALLDAERQGKFK